MYAFHWSAEQDSLMIMVMLVMIIVIILIMMIHIQIMKTKIMTIIALLIIILIPAYSASGNRLLFLRAALWHRSLVFGTEQLECSLKLLRPCQSKLEQVPVVVASYIEGCLRAWMPTSSSLRGRPAGNQWRHTCSQKRIPTPDACRRAILCFMYFYVSSSTWGNPEVGGWG